MSRNLQLSNAANWQLMTSISIPATPLSSNGTKTYYASITPIRPPIYFDKQILAVNIFTEVPAGKKWVYAGSLARFTDTSFGEMFFDKRYALFLGRFNLVITESLSNPYQVQIAVPPWFYLVNLSIYQYEGDDRTLAEKDIDLIKAAVIN